MSSTAAIKQWLPKHKRAQTTVITGTPLSGESLLPPDQPRSLSADDQSEVASLRSVTSGFFRSRSQKLPDLNRLLRPSRRPERSTSSSIITIPSTTASDGARAGLRELPSPMATKASLATAKDSARSSTDTAQSMASGTVLSYTQPLHARPATPPVATSVLSDHTYDSESSLTDELVLEAHFQHAVENNQRGPVPAPADDNLDYWIHGNSQQQAVDVPAYVFERAPSQTHQWEPAEPPSSEAPAGTAAPSQNRLGSLARTDRPFSPYHLPSSSHPQLSTDTVHDNNNDTDDTGSPLDILGFPAPPPPLSRIEGGASAAAPPSSEPRPELFTPPPSAPQAPQPDYYFPQTRYEPLPQTLPHSSLQSIVDPSGGPMSAANTAGHPNPPAPKSLRSSNNRQSIHNTHQPTNAQHTGPTFQAPPPPQLTAGDRSAGAMGRNTPQPPPDELSPEEQLARDHKELREKYTKVKKYYFEKEEQVKQLQNTLAHQRLAQSRTALDDSEYTTRLIRLEGLIGQLAFSIRKSWKAVPLWLAASVNKDAIQTGKHEMTAAGRAFISCWLVDEVFEKYFHPDLEPTLSAQLRNIQKNIRRFAPTSQTHEEEESSWAKVANWRLATLDGLQDVLRAGPATGYRGQLTEMLKEQLMGSLDVHLSDPPMSDLEGGVNMIIELAVGMVAHIPLESRDVIIEYHMPGTHIVTEVMKVESGIPSLGTSVAEDAADAASTKSGADSDEMGTNSYLDSNSNGVDTSRGGKRSMLAAFTGSGKKNAQQASGSKNAAGNGAASLGRPESAGKDDRSDKVRMAVGLSATIRNKNVLVKAPVFNYT